MKIIPAIDLMEGKVVRLYRGDPKKKTIYSENPLEIAKKWESAGADMLHLVDLDATLGTGSNFELLKDIAESVKIPVEVAGAFKDKTVLDKLLKTYGKEKLVISVDHKDGLIVVNGWQQTTDVALIDAVNDFIKMGFSEYLSTSIVRDGTLDGPDLESLKMVNEIKNVNLIVSGGISNIEDIVKVKELDPFGVILGKALYENQVTIEEAKGI